MTYTVKNSKRIEAFRITELVTYEDFGLSNVRIAMSQTEYTETCKQQGWTCDSNKSYYNGNDTFIALYDESNNEGVFFSR